MREGANDREAHSHYPLLERVVYYIGTTGPVKVTSPETATPRALAGCLSVAVRASCGLV
jgi:hypothetical protein